MTAREVGQRIQAIREASGIKQPEFARELGLSTRQLQRIESGASKANTSMLFRIAQKLNIEPSMLLGGSPGEQVTLADLARNESKILQLLEERLPEADALIEVKRLTADNERLKTEVDKLTLLLEQAKNYEHLGNFHPDLPARVRKFAKEELHVLRAQTFIKQYEKMPESERPKVPPSAKPRIKKNR